MNAKNFELAKGLVRPAYVDQGAQSVAARQKLLTSLLSERRLPPRGWDEASIELLVREAAAMDSNNFLANVGVGEREARVACPLVARRHYGFAHGIGRSGDISAEQPKAAGSTLLARLCNLLAVDSLKKAGLLEVGDVTVLPVATGMALTLTLLALAKRRPGARYVVWPRCDQKTCVKAVQAAGLELLVVANVLEGDQLRTDVQAVRVAVESVGAAAVVCVLSTSSCFAPRAADRLVELAQLCASLDVGHVVNNAYGVQSAALCALLTSACRRGRVDAIVQSTDKNFMVPVGGALVAAPRREGPSLVRSTQRRRSPASQPRASGGGCQPSVPWAGVHGAAAGPADDAAPPGFRGLAGSAAGEGSWLLLPPPTTGGGCGGARCGAVCLSVLAGAEACRR